MTDTDIVTRLHAAAQLFVEFGDTSLSLPREAADEIERLREFLLWTLTESFIESREIREKAASLGLIVETTYDPAIHGEVEDAEPGDEWFVFAQRKP